MQTVLNYFTISSLISRRVNAHIHNFSLLPTLVQVRATRPLVSFCLGCGVLTLAVALVATRPQKLNELEIDARADCRLQQRVVPLALGPTVSRLESHGAQTRMNVVYGAGRDTKKHHRCTNKCQKTQTTRSGVHGRSPWHTQNSISPKIYDNEIDSGIRVKPIPSLSLLDPLHTSSLQSP